MNNCTQTALKAVKTEPNIQVQLIDLQPIEFYIKSSEGDFLFLHHLTDF